MAGAKRKPLQRNLRRRINDAAIEAWRRAEYLALHRALKLHPSHRSPLPSSITPLGVSQNTPHEGNKAGDLSVRAAQELQRELIKIAGWPDCRGIYEANLYKAEEDVAYYSELCTNGEGRGRDADFHLQLLEQAVEELIWRRELVASLPKSTDRSGRCAGMALLTRAALLTGSNKRSRRFASMVP